MLVLLSATMGACDKVPHGWRSAFLDYARPDTVERLHVALRRERARGDTARQLNRMLESRNRYLLEQLGELAAIVNQVDHDLSDLSGAGRSVQPLVPASEANEDSLAARALLGERRRRVADNLNRLTSRLHRTDSLWRQAVAEDRGHRDELQRAGQTIEMFRALADSRAAQLAELEGRVDSLTSENGRLADEHTRMSDSLGLVSRRERRVYYVVGTRDDLLDAGIAREITVARRTWRGWRRERQLVLAREADLARVAYTRTLVRIIGGSDDESGGVQQQGEAPRAENGEIQELDRYRDTLLPLPPIHHGRMRILSDQEARFTEGAGHDGEIEPMTSALHITNPDAFWQGGRYLVIVIEP